MSFYVSNDGIVRVEFGEEEVPRHVAVFDPVSTGPEVERLTLDADPIRWAELLPSAYRSGDYRVAVTKVASVDEGELTGRSGISEELAALPH